MRPLNVKSCATIFSPQHIAHCLLCGRRRFFRYSVESFSAHVEGTHLLITLSAETKKKQDITNELNYAEGTKKDLPQWMECGEEELPILPPSTCSILTDEKEKYQFKSFFSIWERGKYIRMNVSSSQDTLNFGILNSNLQTIEQIEHSSLSVCARVCVCMNASSRAF